MILNSKYFQFQCFIIPLGYALTSFMDIPPSYPKRLFLVSQACRSQGFRGCYGTTRADLFILLKPDRDHHTKTGPRIFRSSYGPVPPTLAEILLIATKKIVTSPHCSACNQRTEMFHRPFRALSSRNVDISVV